jgi:hypothetical protein
MANREWIRRRLEHALQALAMPAEVQIALFPSFVCQADELALVFDNFKRAAESNFGGEMTESQRDLLARIDGRLADMSGRHDPELWTQEALRGRDEWARIRALATETLEAFGWPHERPPCYGHEYVRGGRS